MTELLQRASALSPEKRKLLEAAIRRKSVINQTRPKPSAPITLLREEGDGPPLFLAHPLMGVVFPYYELTYLMGSDRPIYGIQSFGADGKVINARSIKTMAAIYIQELKKIQPKGPYYLAGWSLGSQIVYEMACQLSEAGENISFLGLIDTWAPGEGSIKDLATYLWSAIAENWTYVLDYLYLARTQSQQNKRTQPGRKYQRSLAKIVKGSKEFKKLAIPKLSPLLNALRINGLAFLGFKARPFHGELTLFRASKDGTAPQMKPDWGWEKLAKNVRVHTVKGTHMTVLLQPNVGPLAILLRDLLQEADDSSNLVAHP